jgi:hypothetical protein
MNTSASYCGKELSNRQITFIVPYVTASSNVITKQLTTVFFKNIILTADMLIKLVKKPSDVQRRPEALTKFEIVEKENEREHIHEEFIFGIHSVEIDSSILSPKNRSHVGGRRHKSGRNVRLFKFIEFVVFYKEKEKRKRRRKT